MVLFGDGRLRLSVQLYHFVHTLPNQGVKRIWLNVLICDLLGDEYS